MSYFFADLMSGYNVERVVGGAPSLKGIQWACQRHASQRFKQQIMWDADNPMQGRVKKGGEGFVYVITQSDNS